MKLLGITPLGSRVFEATKDSLVALGVALGVMFLLVKLGGLLLTLWERRRRNRD